MPKRDPAFAFIPHHDDSGNPYTYVHATGRFEVDGIPCHWQAGSTVRQSMMKLKDEDTDPGPKMMWSPHELCENHWLKYGAMVFEKDCNKVCEGRFDPYVESFS